MSIHTLTIDEFIMLDAFTHRVALTQYDQAIAAAQAELAEANNPAAHAAVSDRLSSLQTLRKLHQVRLDELAEEGDGEQPADEVEQPYDRVAPGLLNQPFASQQWEQNELQPALV